VLIWVSESEFFGYLLKSFNSGNAALAEVNFDGSSKVFFIIETEYLGELDVR
jgi:hypothetical protein